MKNETTPSTLTSTSFPPDEDLFSVVHGLAELSWELKALNTIVIDLRNIVSYTDYVVITSATSERHVQALARRLDTAMRESGRPPLGTEGVEHGRWALLDYGDVIVHIFNGETRQDYNLERMWLEAPRVEFDDKPAELYGHFEMERFDQ